MAPGDQSVAGIFRALSAAEDALSRLDARLQTSPLAQGFTERIAFHEAVAALWNGGELIHVSDLVLHDAGLDQTMPDPLLAAGRAILQRRRRAARLDAAELGDWAIVEQLLGRRRTRPSAPSAASAALLAATRPRREAATPWWEESVGAPPPLPFLDCMTVAPSALDQDQDVFAAWSAEPAELGAWPATVRAVVALDRWVALQPLGRAQDVGALVVEARLRRDGRVLGPILVEQGRRSLSRRGDVWSSQRTPADRALYWLRSLAEGARLGGNELDALEIAQQRLERHLRQRRASSRLPELCTLLLRTPIVTAASAAQAMNVSQQTVRSMLGELSDVVKESTGRRSFRAWRL